MALFLHVLLPLAVKVNTIRENMAAVKNCRMYIYLRFTAEVTHAPLWSTSIFLPSNKHQLSSLPPPLPSSVSLSMWLIYDFVSRQAT